MAEPKKATIKEWTGLGILGLTSLAVAIDLFVMLLALPQISTSLHASATQLLWITDMYGFLLAGFLVTMGTLGDRIGRRKVWLMGAAAFAAASLFVAFSQTPGMLIFARALLGIAGAMIMPAALSLIQLMFPDPKETAKAIGIWLSCLIGGTILGPLVGGLLLQHFWWGSVFLVGIPPMIFAVLLGKKFLPEFKDEHAGRLHIPSVALSLSAILPFIYGIKELAIDGWSVVPALVLLFGLICGVVFVRQQAGMRDPLVDLTLFKQPVFTTVLVALLVNTALPGAVMVLTTQYLQLVTGFSPLHAGVWMIPAMLASVVGVILTPRLATKVPLHILIPSGLICSILGLLTLTTTSLDGGTAPVIIGFALFNLGSVPLITIGTATIIGAAPPQKAGAAAAISQTSNEFGFAFGIAVVGSIGTAVYYHALRPVEGLSAAANSAAHETFASAIHTAQSLPPVLASALLESSRNAFIQEYRVVALLSAVAVAATAVALFVKLKAPRTASKESPAKASA